jgi:AAA domain
MNQDALLEYVNNLPQTDEQDNYTVLSARKNHPRSYIIWTVQEDTLLIQLYSEKTSIAFIARLLKRSSNAIIIRVKALSIVEKQKKEIPEIDLLSSIQDKKLDDIHSVICYWRNSLADADKMGLLAKDMEQAEQFPFELFQQGQLPQEKIEQFFEEAEKKLKENLKHSSKKSHLQSQDVKLNKLQVIIAPYIAIKNYHHGQQIRGERESNEIFPLWMIANLSRTGDLTPDEDIIYPWIERRCLFPNGERDNGLSYPIIGDVSDVDAFYAQYSILLNKPLEWEKLFTFANDLFLSLCNKESNIFSNQNYSLIKTGFVLPTDSIKEPCRNIIATYDQHLLNQKNIPNLLSKFCSFKDQPYCSDQQPEKCFLVSSQHLGQMQKNYPLSASQRKSIGYFSDLENNEIVTIHGPPGTGKTTLLQSVIASNWVEAACDKKYPPIQVAASTNNLAVTNILDRLNEAGDECARWLPDFKTCGLYLAPAHQVEQAKKNNYQFRIRAHHPSVFNLFRKS